MLRKNTAGQKWIVFAFNRTTNAPQTGDAANITANLRLDGGAANAVDDTNPTELEDGYYAFDLSQAEANGDSIVICPASTTADIQVIGVPGAVWTTTVPGTVAAIETDTQDLQARLPAALVGGRMDASVGAMAAGVVTASAVATGAIDADALAADAGTEIGTAVWASATRSLTDKAGFALSAAGIQAIWDALTSALTTVGSIGKLLVDYLDIAVSSRFDGSLYQAPLDADAVRLAVGLAAPSLDSQLGALPSAADVATAVRGELAPELVALDAPVSTRATGLQVDAIPGQVWDVDASLHTTSGSTGEALLAGAGGGPGLDPLLNVVPGDYPPGSAGYVLGTHLDSPVSDCLQAASYTAPANADITAIKAKTDLIPAAPAATGDIPTAAAIASQVRTELATELGRVDASVSSRLAAASYTAAPTADENAAALLDLADAIEPGLTPRGALRLTTAAAAGEVEPGATTTVSNVGATKTRITATTDESGQRTAVVVDVS
jgi:hypothetical protein